MPATKTPKKTAKLDAEIDQALSQVKASRTRRDLLERPTPARVLHRIDLALQEAEDQVGRHFTTVETRTSSPDVYRLGNEIFDELEALRWKLRRFKMH
jgi:hypothetical protein